MGGNGYNKEKNGPMTYLYKINIHTSPKMNLTVLDIFFNYLKFL